MPNNTTRKCPDCFIPLHSQPCDNPYCSFGRELLGYHSWCEDVGGWIEGEYHPWHQHYEVPEYGTCSRCNGLGQILVCAKCLTAYDFSYQEDQNSLTLRTWLKVHDEVK